MKPTASIIIPTFNNPQYLNPCILSICQTGVLNGLCELIIVNNGSQPIKHLVEDWPNTTVLEPGRNLGWEGGLAAGVKVAKGDFFCFQNDDTFIPKANQGFYSQMLWPFQDKNVAAVGPATTNASGWHSVFAPNATRRMLEVSYLIFFTAMIRCSDYETVGGIDTSCPGGDDIDLSIRFRKAGKKLVVNPDAFLIHHAFKTGERVRGGPDVAGGWNSLEMIDKTNQFLIRKHGFKTYLRTMRGIAPEAPAAGKDTEGDIVAGLVRGGQVIELGCGFRKTVPHAIGIDRCGEGEMCAHLATTKKSVADIEADVTQTLPLEPLSIDTAIARHVLEHSLDVIETMTHWNRVLKMGGRLIVAVPNQVIVNSIPLNPEHAHAFTPASLRRLAEASGFRHTETVDPHNGISFVSCFEKILHPVAVDEIAQERGELVNA